MNLLSIERPGRQCVKDMAVVIERAGADQQPPVFGLKKVQHIGFDHSVHFSRACLMFRRSFIDGEELNLITTFLTPA